MAPITPPAAAQMYQLHAGTSEHSGALVTNAASFESSAATIAPLKNPSHAVKHPIATRRFTDTFDGWPLRLATGSRFGSSMDESSGSRRRCSPRQCQYDAVSAYLGSARRWRRVK